MQLNTTADFHKKYRISDSGCWEWLGFLNEWGYGRFNMNGRKILAHRASWEIHFGPIYLGALVCHKCDNPSCVNPNHLFLGSVKDNAVDMAAKGRQNGPRGVSHHSAKLNPDLVREIRQKHKSGLLGTYDIAREYGVTQAAAWAVVARKTWKHVE